MCYRIKKKWNGLWYVQAKRWFVWVTINPVYLGCLNYNGFEFRETAEEFKQYLEGLEQ